MHASFRDELVATGQEHVLRFLDRLDSADRIQLEEQLQDIDLRQLFQLVHGKQHQHDWAQMARRSQPPPAFRPGDPSDTVGCGRARREGEQALRDGKVGVILVAGGQGTRLGFPHPKGMFPIGPVSHNSIFQILIEHVLAIARRYGRPLPLYVMTSPATHEQTVSYLDEHDRFGMPAKDVGVFCQGTMPAVDAHTGKLLMSNAKSLALAPDGHGGMLAALVRDGLLQQARERGIEHLSYGQIDNPLVQICQPELLGYHLLAASEMTSQVVRKTDPLDKVGNVVVVDGKMGVIEYSDLPEDAARRRNADGSLFIWAGSIAVHVFAVSFLERMSHLANALPFHQALKKVPYVDERGVFHDPNEPNAIKFERFVFDLLPHAEDAIVVEGKKSEVFAPLKNADGAADDTATDVRDAMVRLHSRWLHSAGATVKPGVPVEISPLWAVDAEQVAERMTEPLEIQQPTYLHE